MLISTATDSYHLSDNNIIMTDDLPYDVSYILSDVKILRDYLKYVDTNTFKTVYFKVCMLSCVANKKAGELKLLLKYAEQNQILLKDDYNGLFKIAVKNSYCNQNRTILQLLLEKEELLCPPRALQICMLIAIKNTSLPLIHSIIKRGINLQDQPKISSKLIDAAIRANKNKEILKLLVQQPGININVKNSNGNTPCHEAVSNVNMLKILINANAYPDHKNDKGYTPLEIAVLNNREASVKILLEQENVTIPKNILMHQGLIYPKPGFQNTNEIIKAANRRKINIGQSGEALGIAIENKDTGAVKALLNNGADPNMLWSETTNLSFFQRVLVDNKFSRFISVFIENVAEKLNFQSTINNKSVFALVLAKIHTASKLDRLLSIRPDILKQSCEVEGFTWTHYAPNSEIKYLLVSKGIRSCFTDQQQNQRNSYKSACCITCNDHYCSNCTQDMFLFACCGRLVCWLCYSKTKDYIFDSMCFLCIKNKNALASQAMLMLKEKNNQNFIDIFFTSK